MKLLCLLIALYVSGIPVLYAQGLNFNDSAYRKLPQKPSHQVIGDHGLPPRVDWSMYVPTVINQGKLGTCVGVSTAYYMRTILEAKRLNITDREAVDALRYSPSFLYNSIKNEGDNDCSKGTEVEKALAYLKKHGVARFSEQGYPYCGQNKPLTLAAESKILDYIRLFSLTDRPESVVTATQKALAEGTPVIVGIQTTPSLDDLGFWGKLWLRILQFFGQAPNDEIGLWNPAKSKVLRGGHAVCVIGYDNAKFGGAFHLVNSRGEDWGDNGFFWIRYEDYIKHAKYGFQAYLPTPSHSTAVVLSGDVTIEFASLLSNNEVPFLRKFSDNAADSSDKIVAYTLRYPQPSGTRFKFSTNVDKQSYLYVLGANATQGSTDKLFPFADSVSAIIGADTKVVLPSENQLYQLDQTTGTEYWLFLFSETALDINGYITRLNAGSGTFPQRVLSVFGQESVPFGQVDYKTKKIGFELRGKHTGTVVPLLISLRHIDKRSW
ncbi:MAG: C1 family peptidase [Spirosomataceae bacterium]